MAEQPGPISFAPIPLGASVGPPGDFESDLLSRMAQAETGSITGRAGPLPSFLVPDERTEREQLQSSILRTGPEVGIGAVPGEETDILMRRALVTEVAKLKLDRARAEAEGKERRATQEDIRGAEIAILMAKARRGALGGTLPDAKQRLVDLRVEQDDAQQELLKRTEGLAAFDRLEAATLEKGKATLLDPGGRREALQAAVAEAAKLVADPDRTSMRRVKDLLVGGHLRDEQSRATGGVINARKLAKDRRAFLDAIPEDDARAMLKIDIERSAAQENAIPGDIADAFRVSPLGSRGAGLFGRGFAAGITFDASEAIRTGVFGERGLAEEMAGGNEGDWIPVVLGYMAGATANFVALDQALVKSGVRTFSGRALPERLMIETAMQEVPRIPAIVFSGRARGLSDDQILKEVGVVLGLGILTGGVLGLGGAAASFGVRKSLAGGIVLSREFGRQVARAGRGLGRIARQAPEKFPAILDLTRSFDNILVTSVGGVTGDAPRRLVRSKPELLKIAQAVISQRGLSAGEVAKVVRQVAPKRGASGKLEGLSAREIGEVGRELLDPQPSVPRGTKLNDEDHLFFAVPAREADELRRSGVTPLGTQFHTNPGAATANIKGKAEVFAIPASVVRSIPESADARAAMEAIELPSLSKTAQGGAKESLSTQLRGFSDHEAFGLDPVETLLANPVPGAMRSLPDELGRAGKLRRRLLPSEFLRSKAYGEAYYGISRNMIEGWAPVHGRRWVQMVDQTEELATAGRGEFQARYEELTRSLSAREINDMELAFANRKPLSPNAHPRVKKALRERQQYDSDKMDKIESPLSDGSLMQKADGTPFRRLEGGHISQPWELGLVEAVETSSQTKMKLDKATGKFRMWDPETNKFTSPSVTGRRLKQQLGRFKLYNELIEMAARQMDEKGMRYVTGKQAFRTGVGTKAKMSDLKDQARHFFMDNRNVLAAQQLTRVRTPSSRDIVEGTGPRRMGAIEFNRLFEYDLKFIRPNLGDNEMRHVASLFDRRAEVEVFGPKLERLTEAFRAVQEEISQRGLGPKKAAQALESMRQLYARETGNLAVDASIDALAFARQSSTLQWVRNLTSGMFLGPGSTFQLGGNAIWAVMGAAFQVPVKNVAKEFGWATLASSSAGGAGGAFLGDLLGDTPEEKTRLAALLGVLGFAGGFGATLPIDSTARALTPAVLPIAAALTGALLPDSEDSAIVERSLLAAGGWLGATAIARGRPIRRLASSSTVVRAARSAGALSVGGLTQADLVTNALSPAFRDKRGPLGEFIKDTMFGVIQATEVWARSSSAKAQLAAATEIIDNFVANPKLRDTPAGKAFSRQLERLGLSRETVDSVIERNEGILPDALVDRVMRKGVNNTQYNLRPLDIPLKWSSPWGKFYTQFMGMQLRQFQNGLRFSLQEAGLGNWMPLFKVTAFSLTAGWTVQELRDFVNGNDLTPRARNKFTRFVQILGPAIGLFETPARVGARVSEGAPLGRTAIEAVIPPSVGAAEQIVDAMFDSARSVMNDDPDVKRGRGRAGDAIRRFPPVNAIGNVARRVAPTDEQRLEEFARQMPRRLEEIEAARAGKSLTDYLQRLPETPPESTFFQARQLAERAAPSIENTLRNVASGIGFLPVAPSKQSAEAKAQGVLDRLSGAPGLLEREAAFRTRVKGEGQKDVTAESLFTGLQKRAATEARKGIIDRIASGIRDDDNEVMEDNIDRFMRMGGRATSLISALRQRATNTRDESLATTIPEDFIHAAELRIGGASSTDAAGELRRRPRNPVRVRALIERLQSGP